MSLRPTITGTVPIMVSKSLGELVNQAKAANTPAEANCPGVMTDLDILTTEACKACGNKNVHMKFDHDGADDNEGTILVRWAVKLLSRLPCLSCTASKPDSCIDSP
jgi:hypothetical protein